MTTASIVCFFIKVICNFGTTQPPQTYKNTTVYYYINRDIPTRLTHSHIMMRISKIGVTGLQVMSLCAFILYQPSVLANENLDGSNDFFRQPSLPKHHQERAQAREGGGERVSVFIRNYERLFLVGLCN